MDQKRGAHSHSGRTRCRTVVPWPAPFPLNQVPNILSKILRRIQLGQRQGVRSHKGGLTHSRLVILRAGVLHADCSKPGGNELLVAELDQLLDGGLILRRLHKRTERHVSSPAGPTCSMGSQAPANFLETDSRSMIHQRGQMQTQDIVRRLARPSLQLRLDPSSI